MLTSDDKKDDNYFKVTFKQLQVPGGAPAAPTQQQAGTGGTTNIEKVSVHGLFE